MSSTNKAACYALDVLTIAPLLLLQMHTSSSALRVCELTHDRLAEPMPKDLAWNYDVVSGLA